MASIPEPINHKETAINQHLVPRCYMKAWTYNTAQSSVWLYKSNGQFTDLELSSENTFISFKSKNKLHR
ncbi:hypothetical protein bhn_I0903 [Butyrivibrio hungatei]|uniref:DUF4238 domain-containing protein n=1 Tax=Butyrivibrio hungatei TaxID=185008 RepID=A0A1D9P030_9FIRM|nr:hypothetical protein bhn_I0903 [Butyrivibrio hungatei]